MTQTPSPPVIRQDLSLSAAEANPDGSPAWIVHDDLNGRYYRLAQLQMELLPYIDGRSAQQIAEAASNDLLREIAPETIEQIFEFLRHNNLVVVDATQHAWLSNQRAAKPSLMKTMTRSYLFFRIPLVRPDRFLTKTLPYVRFLGTATAFRVLAAIAVVGIVLALQSFDSFKATFLYFFNVEGLVYFLTALIGVKLLHELGHGYVAKAVGCRVPVMGVAFMVMWPVLYTDTSDAWRISSRNKRLKIDAAGVAVELGVASIALLAWSFTPDGPLRSVFFILASSTWLVSLGVNLNPLMRFDGYYLLSDYWRVPNLEPRSQALARWWLREKLFGLDEEPPENPQKKLIFYAMSVWVYRFLLFLGIALLVYALFFKLLGILLFLIEIIYFIVAPIYREIKQWHERRAHMRWNFQTKRTLFIVVALVLMFVVPWRSSTQFPAIVKASSYQLIYAPENGRLHLDGIHDGQSVATGQKLLVIESPELAFEFEQAQRRIEELKWENDSIGFNSDIRSRALVTSSALESQRKRMISLGAQVARLTVEAPISGTVVDFDPNLREGMWVSRDTALFALVNAGSFEVLAYSSESSVGKLALGQTGTFYPEGGGASPFSVELGEIESFGLSKLDQLYTASLFGGDVAVRETSAGDLLPVEAVYRLKLAADLDVLPARVLRGTVVLQSTPTSFLSRFWRVVNTVFIRESSF